MQNMISVALPYGWPFSLMLIAFGCGKWGSGVLNNFKRLSGNA
jgi:hypothetical protein